MASPLDRLLSLFRSIVRPRGETLRLRDGSVAPPPPPAPTLPAARTDSLVERVVRRWDSMINALSGLGGAYDKGTTARPDTERAMLSWAELSALYRDNGYARRLVNIVPSDATRKGWRVLDDSGEGDRLEKETRRLDVYDKVRRGLQWGRLYGACIVLMVLDEDIPEQYRQNPGRWLEQPLDLSRVIRLRSLVPLESMDARPAEYVTDIRSPDFREIRLWSISASASSAGGMAGTRVHHTRVLYFPGEELPPYLRQLNNGIDASILDGIWDQIRNKTSIDQAAALLAQELNVSAITVAGLEGMNTEDQYSLFDARMKAIARSKSLCNAVVMGQGETFENKAASVSGFTELDANAKEALCAVTGMPSAILFGEAPGGLNTDGDSHRKLWVNVIASFQQDRLLGPLTQLYTVVYAQKRGPTAGQIPAEWSIEFLPLDELTSKEQAELEKIHADTDAVRVQNGILPAEHIAASRYGPTGYQNALLPYDPRGAEAAMQAEADRLAQTAAEMAPLRPLGTGAPAPGSAGAETTDAVAPVDETVSRLAEKMTAHGIERCEHGSSNRCRICGIERVRDLVEGPDGSPVRGPDGAPVWRVAWRPIYGVVAADDRADGDPVDHHYPVVLQPPRVARDPYPFVGFIDFQWIPVDVENAAGSTRTGTSADGTAWTVPMHYHYGEIHGAEGVDGDHVDVYVGPNADAQVVVVVRQHDPATAAYDEDKVMLGFDTVEAAVEAYQRQYDRPGFFVEGDYRVMTVPQLRRWIQARWAVSGVASA